MVRANMSLLVSMADTTPTTTAIGLVNTLRTLGGCVSIAVCGAILNRELDKRYESLTIEQASLSFSMAAPFRR